MPLGASVYCALWSPAGKELTSWLSFVVPNCEFVTFPSLTYFVLYVCVYFSLDAIGWSLVCDCDIFLFKHTLFFPM